MRLSFSLCALALALTPLVAQAQGKRMGPSAVEAARLKQYPPNNFLAHYLPDDRYKIAGGVWKYVTTDLDTYYHIPSSPNMMRQPASRVEGFANSHDAEEAGYEPDPTDGTAARVEAGKAATEAALGGMHMGGGIVTGGYVGQITALLTAEKRDEMKMVASLRGQGQQQIGASNMAPLRKMFSQSARVAATYVMRLRAIKPPVRYARFHQLLLQSQRNQVAALNRFAKQMSGGGFSLDSLNIMDLMSAQTQLVQEAQRVGINPQILR